MPFFKDLRRKRASIAVESEKNSDVSNSSESNTTGPTYNKSSSSLSSMHNGTITPASSIQLNNQSQPSLPTTSKSNATFSSAIPQRPMPLTSVGNRSSFHGLNTPSINGTAPPKASLSTFAPRILSVSDNSWVHQKVLLVYGRVGDPNERPIDGSITVCHHQDNFPATTWPVSDSHFKALVHLTPGPNRLRFDFTSPKLTSGKNHLPTHCAWTTINFLPLNNSPPLNLVIIIGKDSPLTYDATPDKKQREGNSLELAIQKFRMAAYLWQAFTGEQMFRHGFGRRCFRFEEEWQTGTLTQRDVDMNHMRNEAKIHVIRSKKTTRELRNLDYAQQYVGATRKGELYDIAMDEVRTYFNHVPGQKIYVSAMLLDAHWDRHMNTIAAHAALGGGSDDLQLAIFGSHALHSYPSSIEQVVAAFSDGTKTDTSFVANDCNESGSSWEAANIGIGAHLHETGHLFGCPHQESGVMLRDYVHFNRTFVTREPPATRTGSNGLQLVLPKDECAWHRLDTLRFKYHPCFGLPTDAPLNPDESIQIWPADHGKMIITAPTGVAFVEIFADREDTCKAWIEFGSGDVQAGGPPRQVSLTEDDLHSKLNRSRKAKHLKIKVFSAGLGDYVVEDVGELLRSKNYAVKLPNGQMGFTGCKLGASVQPDTQPQQVLLETAFIQTKLLTCVRVYHGYALDGLEFMYEDATSQLFGKQGGRADDFVFDTRRGEILLGFYVRAGLWIDGIEILTSLGRKSGVYGCATGGSGHTLIPPRGYGIAGVSGTCGRWTDGFSLIITR